MGMPKPSKPAKLFVGMIAQNLTYVNLAFKDLEACYGPADFESMIWPWNYTDYYAQEFGDGLKRKFIFFKRLIEPDRLPEIKRATHEMEIQTGQMVKGVLRRRANLDPGYITDAKVVLATTKDFAHRIYLREGIYAEVTLVYRGNGFQPMPYTYPDYRTREYLELFNQARELYRRACLDTALRPSSSLRSAQESSAC